MPVRFGSSFGSQQKDAMQSWETNFLLYIWLPGFHLYADNGAIFYRFEQSKQKMENSPFPDFCFSHFKTKIHWPSRTQTEHINFLATHESWYIASVDIVRWSGALRQYMFLEWSCSTWDSRRWDTIQFISTWMETWMREEAMIHRPLSWIYLSIIPFPAV